MRKVFAALLIFSVLLVGCETPTQLAEYKFVNVEWTRTTDVCTETLRFREDGTCSYYCACGEPVNDDDLCEGYRYDYKTNTIHLDFMGTTEETVTEITIKSCDGETLVLDFGGEERVFEKAQEDEAWADTLNFNGKTYRYLQFPGDIFNYDLRESVNYEEDTVLPIPHETWDLVYREGDLFVEESQWDAAVADYADDANYTWSIWMEASETEEGEVKPVTVTDEDLTYIYTMEDRKGDTTLFFDDIQQFGMLTKTHKDGLIAASTSLARYEGVWYWRSETIDETAEGWPEYVVKLPDSITAQIPKT